MLRSFLKVLCTMRFYMKFLSLRFSGLIIFLIFYFRPKWVLSYLLPTTLWHDGPIKVVVSNDFFFIVSKSFDFSSQKTTCTYYQSIEPSGMKCWAQVVIMIVLSLNVKCTRMVHLWEKSKLSDYKDHVTSLMLLCLNSKYILESLDSVSKERCYNGGQLLC